MGCIFTSLFTLSNIDNWASPCFFPSYTFRGFLTGGGYEGLPLERNAYLLDECYEKNPARVADEVVEWTAKGRF
jgi:hypothetical protein